MKKLITFLTLFIACLPAAIQLPAQNVGIGTTTPEPKALLELQSTTGGLLLPRMTAANITAISAGATEEGMVLYQTNSSKGLYIFDGALWRPAGNVENGGTTGAVPRWDGARYQPSTVLYQTGSLVGIGTTTPDVQLHINGAAASSQRIHFTNITTGTTLLDGLLIGIPGPAGDAVIIQNEAQALSFGTAANERMRIEANGNVGINSPFPGARLDVGGTVKLGLIGSVLNAVLKTTVSINIPAMAADSENTQTVTVANAAVGASVYVSPAAALTGIVIAYARVSSAGNVEIKFTNTSAAAVDPAAMNFFITVIQ